ncbi:hypothetical protein BDR26DRAFT_873766 [Obelidium mucronatum]|nr:hypothetical protein BDR26DRAFT_873766 [Obelidium mucronatum]
MFSNPSDDIDATLSALLSSDQPHFNLERPPITTTTNTTNIGHAIMAANKRTLSSAAFSLGSYTAADLKKLRTDFNYSGIDLDWLMGDSSSDAKEGGGVGTANGAKNRPIAEPTRRVPVSMGAPLVFPSAQLQQQYQQQEQNHQQLFQSMAIPAHIGELARPIAIDTLTPENYLRMLLEAHHLVGQAHSYLGARDYQAVAHDLIASGVRPQDLTNAQLSQIVQGIQQIDLGTTGNVTSGMPGGNPTNPVSAIPPAQHATNLFGNQLGMFQQQQPQQHQQQLQHRLIQEPISANTHQPPQPNPPKIITCPHCSKQYKSHSGFKYHMEHQHPLESSSSKQQHNSSNDLLFSKQIPPASPSLNLPFSSLGFSSPTALQQLDDPNSLFGSDGLPKRQIHPSQLNKPFKCSVAGCLKSYKNKGGLKYHVEHEHPETL